MTGPADAEETLRKQLALVDARLVIELADELPPQTIRQAVHDAVHRYDNAPVKQFIPVLVARAAREQLLHDRQHNGRRAG